MQSSKVFISGNSQAVRIPKEYQVNDQELFIQKVGDAIILFPKSDPWKLFEESLNEFSHEFLENGRKQPSVQIRENL